MINNSNCTLDLCVRQWVSTLWDLSAGAAAEIVAVTTRPIYVQKLYFFVVEAVLTTTKHIEIGYTQGTPDDDAYLADAELTAAAGTADTLVDISPSSFAILVPANKVLTCSAPAKANAGTGYAIVEWVFADETQQIRKVP